jgi:WD40 repeat protein/serine/threonine protein kinase
MIAHEIGKEFEIPWPNIRGYQILSVIGSGGMGIVYKAQHRELQRVVAIKTLRGSALSDREFRERFRVEAEAVARLQHPNIIQVFEIGTIEPQPGEVQPSPFIALEFVDGGSLVRFTDKPQPPRVAAEIIEKIARAVHSAHRVGVVHRDLKPANVLLTRDGEPKIADFGLAKQLGDERDEGGRFLTQAGTVMGTPEYMAPEQAVGEPPTPAIDVYALGVMLYELLTARVPFCGATPVDTMTLLHSQLPVSPRRLQPSVPRDLDTIVMKCLEKSPAKRYESAEALADDLRLWLDCKPIRARPIGSMARLNRWSSRNPGVAFLSATVVLVTLLGVGGVFWKWIEAVDNLAAANAASENALRFARSERWERYRANIVAASSSLQLHNVSLARQALEAAPKEHRNWEWNYFQCQIDTAQHVLDRPFPLSGFAFISADGRRAVCEMADNGVSVWNIATKTEVGRVSHEPRAKLLLTTPDAMTLVFRTPNGDAIRAVNLGSGQVSFEIPSNGHEIIWYRLVGNGRLLMIGSSDKTCRIWDMSAGKQIKVIDGKNSDGFWELASQNGRWLFSFNSATATVSKWDAESGQKVASFKGHNYRIEKYECSECGRYFATVESYPACKVRVCDTLSGRPPVVLEGHTNQVLEVKFSPDCTRIATCSLDQTARIWDTPKGQLLHIMREHKGWVVSVGFSPCGKRLVTGSQDATVRVWDANQGGHSIAVLHGHPTSILEVRYSSDGSRIISNCGAHSLRIWDVHAIEFNDVFRGHSNFVYGVSVDRDGRRLASASWDGTARIWDARTGKQLRVLDHGKTSVVSVAFHPKRDIVATLSRDATVCFWDVISGKRIGHWSVRTDRWRDSRVAFSPCGDLLAVGSTDGVYLWDMKTMTEARALKGGKDMFRDVVFSPDGRWLASAGELFDKHVHVWDVTTGTHLCMLEGHTSAVYCLAVSRDGRWLASGSPDGTIRLWDTNTWALSAVLQNATNVYGLAFSPDGTRLAAGCADNTIRLWDMTARQQVAELTGHGAYVHQLQFSSDGTQLFSASGDFMLRAWDTIKNRGPTR